MKSAMSQHLRSALMAVARGELAADLVIRNATICNVYSGEMWRAHVAIAGERIAYVGEKPPAGREEWDAQGCFVAPGLIEPHAHPDILYNPATLVEAVLPRGTTTLFCDDTAFAGNLAACQRELADLPATLRWLAHYALPTTGVDAAEGPWSQDGVARRLSQPMIEGTAEFAR